MRRLSDISPGAPAASTPLAGTRRPEVPAANYDRSLAIGAGLSSRSGADAGAHASDQCLAALQAGGSGRAGADLVLMFYTAHHAEHLATLRLAVHKALMPRCIVGVSAQGVIAGAIEQERGPGLAMLALSLPNVELTGFSSTDLPLAFGDEADAADSDDTDDDGDLAHLAQAVGMKPGHRATLVFADPFSVNGQALLPALARARALCDMTGSGEPHPATPADAMLSGRRGVVMGGLASASSRPRGNALLLDDRVVREGLVGVTLRGPVRVDPIVSQGCRAFGPTVVVTSAKGNIVRSLAGRPALDVLQEAVESLGEEERQQLSKGVFVGRVVNEYKERFGRDDYLIRNVVGVSREERAIAVGERVRTGQTVRFHMRDARTATEDLAMLMDAQRLHTPPAGVLLVTCNGRGRQLFEPPLGPHHDARALERLFQLPAPEAGERVSKGGTPVGENTKAPPLAGFFAAGEIGPVGDGVFLHGHTACAAVFRRA